MFYILNFKSLSFLYTDNFNYYIIIFQGLNHQKEYIAAQGPSQNTVEHFTQMIWEQKCTHIVMLTLLVENGTKVYAIQQFICILLCCVQENL